MGYVGFRWFLKITGLLPKIDLLIVRVAGAFLGSCIKVLVFSLFLKFDFLWLLFYMVMEGAIWAIIVFVFLLAVKFFDRKK